MPKYITEYLDLADDAPVLALGTDPADAMVGAVADSPGDESVNHDHYLYGWPKPDVRSACQP